MLCHFLCGPRARGPRAPGEGRTKRRRGCATSAASEGGWRRRGPAGRGSALLVAWRPLSTSQTELWYLFLGPAWPPPTRADAAATWRGHPLRPSSVRARGARGPAPASVAPRSTRPRAGGRAEGLDRACGAGDAGPAAACLRTRRRLGRLA